MQVEIKIDPDCPEPRIVIVTDQVSEEINHVLRTISASSGKQMTMMTGFRDDLAEILTPSDIVRIYASGGKTFASVNGQEYVLRQRLYEWEEQLAAYHFVRISNSEIINLNKVRNFDLSLTGTICVALSDGTVTYVSRRYVSRIKQMLGL